MFFAKKNRFVAASIAAVVLASSAPASFAATASGTLTISASVVAACTVVGSAIAFGAYTQSVVNQSGTITVLCTNGTAYNVGLDAGTARGVGACNRENVCYCVCHLASLRTEAGAGQRRMQCQRLPPPA